VMAERQLADIIAAEQVPAPAVPALPAGVLAASPASGPVSSNGATAPSEARVAQTARVGQG